jgi:hypothetical protein
MQNKKRYPVLAAVVGIHAVVFGMLLSSSRTLSLPVSGGTSLQAFILTRAARRHPPVERPPPAGSSSPIAPLVEPITLAPPASVAVGPSRRTVDWGAAAKRAAATILQPRKRVSFGFPAGGKSAITLGVPSPHTPAHHAGESDRTLGGEVTEWTSDRCYIVSDPPSPFAPASASHAGVTRSGCLPPPGPDPGELFKSLPAYKKLHPP